jgi:hypothetical protein
MVKLYSSLLLIFILSSCRSEKTTKYYWVDFRSSINPRTDTIEIKRINRFQKADTVKLSYYSTVDTIHYTFLKSQGDSASKVDNQRFMFEIPPTRYIFLPFYVNTFLAASAT